MTFAVSAERGIVAAALPTVEVTLGLVLFLHTLDKVPDEAASRPARPRECSRPPGTLRGPGDGRLVEHHVAIHNWIILAERQSGVLLQGRLLRPVRKACLHRAHELHGQTLGFVPKQHMAGREHGAPWAKSQGREWPARALPPVRPQVRPAGVRAR
eukprot:CAMPEP_0179098828 /NCGR_PEP_ID=MMETSP0796-20121207/45563_1 /TAXON_ID=73915 /ORGANISM="Pyrodinium bahamense, Strain pbaha01" /LENGTH=155 /DNA_ID=CAMNT_0020796615 /DNA_START=13 /DNA_END=478 /DNA_ORIENTATION=+